MVKCLALYHPDDPDELRQRQVRQLQRLQDAARKTRHELLVEIIAARHGALDPATVSRAMQQLYDAGMKPDWWKLEPSDDAASWAHVAATIAANDPLCRGVVLLGQLTSHEALLASFRAAASAPVVKGFAVGRSIWAEAAQRWMAGEIDDEAAIADLAQRLGVLVAAWRAAKGRAGTTTAVHAAVSP